jgi:hypothetical protein
MHFLTRIAIMSSVIFLHSLQWGFLRILKGPGAGGYTHEYFVRGQVDLCKKMKRIKVKGSPEKRLKPIRCPKTTGIPDVPQKTTTLSSNKKNKNEAYNHAVQQRNSGTRFLSTSSFSTSQHDIFGGERFFSTSSAPTYHADWRLQHDHQSGTALVVSSIDPLPLNSSIHSSTSSMLFDSNDFANLCWDLLSN